MFRNNEPGLLPKHVLAMSSIAESTKQAGKDNIGQKGIGFKSVFAISGKFLINICRVH